MHDLVIFDLDGTLIDSKEDLVHSVNAMLAARGREPLPHDVVASYVGNGAPVLVQRALPDVSRRNCPPPCNISSTTIAPTCSIRPRSIPGCAKPSTVSIASAFRWRF